jgi:hypothetical protein
MLFIIYEKSRKVTKILFSFFISSRNFRLFRISSHENLGILRNFFGKNWIYRSYIIIITVKIKNTIKFYKTIHKYI